MQACTVTLKHNAHSLLLQLCFNTHTYTHTPLHCWHSHLSFQEVTAIRPPSQMPLFHYSVNVALYNSCSLITWLTVCILCKSNCNQTTECGTSQLVRLEVFVVVNSGKKVSVQQPCSSVLMNSSVNNSQWQQFPALSVFTREIVSFLIKWIRINQAVHCGCVSEGGSSYHPENANTHTRALTNN